MVPEQRLYPDEEWFAITLTVEPLTAADPEAFVATFSTALRSRDFFRNTRIAWDGDDTRLLVYIEDRGYGETATASNVTQELVEILDTLPTPPDGYRVGVVTSRQVP